MITKKQARRLSVAQVLRLIYERQLHEATLGEKSKEELLLFILELFNKGQLNDYLGCRH